MGPFRDGLRDLGYVEGKSIAIEYRWAEGDYTRFPTLIKELIAAKAEIIVTAGTPSTLAAGRSPVPASPRADHGFRARASPTRRARLSRARRRGRIDVLRAEIRRHAPVFVDRILRGAKPGDLPVERPASFELVVNLKTARKFGLTIPESVVLRASEVLQ